MTTASGRQRGLPILELRTGPLAQQAATDGQKENDDGRNNAQGTRFEDQSDHILAKPITNPSLQDLGKQTDAQHPAKADQQQLVEGVELEDGPMHFDEMSLLDESKMNVGVEIHSGRNRIIRRMFEHLGYRVKKLDRVSFAGLTKKDVPRGKWRLLNDKEVRMLKQIRKSRQPRR